MKRKFFACLTLSLAFLFASISFCYAQEWEFIGSVKVAKKKNHADISVANQEALYKQLQLTAHEGFIELKRIIALTPGGESYTIELQTFLDTGETSAPIELSEKGIALSSVTIIYYTKRRPVLELYGLSAASDK